MSISKIVKSYTKSKNKKGMTKVHSYLAIFGIMIGIVALIVVSSALNGFSKDLYGKLSIDSDLTLTLNDSIEKEDLNILLKKQKEIKEIREIKKFKSYETIIGGNNEVNLIISKDSELKEDTVYVSEKLKGLSEKKYLTLDIEEDNEILDQLILKIDFDKKIKNPKRVVISESSLLDNSLLDLSNQFEEQIELKLNNFMKAPELSEVLINKIEVKKVDSWTSKQSNFFNALQLEQTIIKIVLFFVILVSCVNIISTLTLIINEKKQDIYVLKTIGYSDKQILSIFVLVGMWLGFLGLFLGTIIGILITLNLTSILFFLEGILGLSFIPKSVTSFPYVLNIAEIVRINTFTGVIILISSLIPALNTLKMSPAEGLKDE